MKINQPGSSIMSDQLPAITVISAYGRGYWLAKELTTIGHKVTIIDLTQNFKWQPEDWDGPFGLFTNKLISKNYIESIIEGANLEESSSGLSLWTDSGPIDFKSSLSSYLLENSGLPQPTLDYLAHYFRDYKQNDFKDRVYDLKNDYTYDQTWVAHWAHFASNMVFDISNHHLDNGAPLSLFSSHYLKHNNRQTLLKLKQWVTDFGVKVIEADSLAGLCVQEQKISTLSVLDENNNETEVNCEQLIWCLNREETAHSSHENVLKLFEQKFNPLMGWVRYSVKFTQKFREQFQYTPNSFVMIGDIDLSWTKDQFLWFNKTTDESVYDVWSLVPYSMAWNEPYLEQNWTNIKKQMKLKWRDSGYELLQWPMSYKHTMLETGPLPTLKYDIDEQPNQTKSNFGNVTFNQSEVWSNSDLFSRFLFETNLLKQQGLQK